MHPLPKISLAYKLLVQDEKQRQVINTPTSIQMIYANATDNNIENTGHSNNNYKPKFFLRIEGRRLRSKMLIS